MAQNTWEKNN